MNLIFAAIANEISFEVNILTNIYELKFRIEESPAKRSFFAKRDINFQNYL